MIRETGRVWSGAILTPRDGRMFVAVAGQWRVPTIALPASIGNAKEGAIVCSSSTWIGLDGTRDYLHSSLPQIGTIQCVTAKNGQPVAEYFAFREWWCDGHRSLPTRLWPVAPGDLVACTLTVKRLSQVTFTMKLTAGSVTSSTEITEDAPSKPARGTSLPPIQRVVSGATAQWITERPSDPDSHNKGTGEPGKPYELANYDKVLFENCVATAAHAPASADRADYSLTGPGVALRDMVRIRQNRAEVISKAELQGPRSVATFYRGP